MDTFLHTIKEAVIDGALVGKTLDFYFQGNIANVSDFCVTFGEIHCTYKDFPDGYEDHDVVLDFCTDEFIAAVFHAIARQTGHTKHDKNLFH